MSKKEEIVKEARSWIGTRYRHQSCTKGQGCDCAGLIRACMKVGGIEYDNAWNYSRIPHSPTLRKKLNEYLIRIPFSDLGAGDILLFRIYQEPCHLAIYSGKNSIIHAFAKGPRKVAETRLDESWRQKIMGCYRIPGVE